MTTSSTDWPALARSPIGRMMERIGSKRTTNMWSGMMAGFKERAETGKEIGGETPLPLEAVRVG